MVGRGQERIEQALSPQMQLRNPVTKQLRRLIVGPYVVYLFCSPPLPCNSDRLVHFERATETPGIRHNVNKLGKNLRCHRQAVGAIYQI